MIRLRNRFFPFAGLSLRFPVLEAGFGRLSGTTAAQSRWLVSERVRARQRQRISPDSDVFRFPPERSHTLRLHLEALPVWNMDGWVDRRRSLSPHLRLNLPTTQPNLLFLGIRRLNAACDDRWSPQQKPTKSFQSHAHLAPRASTQDPTAEASMGWQSGKMRRLNHHADHMMQHVQ